MANNKSKRGDDTRKATWRNHQAKDWILVRLQRETHRQLCEVRESMRVADAMGALELEKDDRDRVSLDAVIRRLIEIREKHAQRRRRSAAKKLGNSLPEQPATEGE